MITIAKAKQLREKIEKAAQSLPDEDALEAKELFEHWASGVAYVTGIRVKYGEHLYSCLQDHVSQIEWNPVDAPALWAKVLIPDPGEIPVWEQPGSTNPYMMGDKVHFPTIDDPVYISIVDNNVWSPADYGWELMEE